MKKSEKDEELQSRREFLKKTAKGALPILGISLFGTSILSSCKKDDDDKKSDNGKCGCSNTCSGSCDGDCSGNCDGCTGGCDGTACKYM